MTDDLRSPAATPTAAQWNADHLIGTRVNAWPGTRDGAGLRTTTRSLAWTLGDGTPVVAVKGYPGGIALSHVEPVTEAPVIDAAHFERQRAWSLGTFGPGARVKGVLAHIRKELAEVERDPTDATEWIDVMILAADGALRNGADPQQIIDTLLAKQTRNEARTWPDWRTMSEDEAIEHVRAARGGATA